MGISNKVIQEVKPESKTVVVRSKSRGVPHIECYDRFVYFPCDESYNAGEVQRCNLSEMKAIV